MRKKWKDETGSGIIWAMAVGGFLILIVGAALTISYAYHQRSIKNEDTRQVYLTARSGADLIVNEFTAWSSTASSIYTYLQTNTVWTVEDVGFEKDMGTCRLSVKLEKPENNTTTKRTVTVTSTAKLEGKTKTVIATLVGVVQRDGTTPAPAPSLEPGAATPTPSQQQLTWYVSSYTDGGDR